MQYIYIFLFTHGNRTIITLWCSHMFAASVERAATKSSHHHNQTTFHLSFCGFSLAARDEEMSRCCVVLMTRHTYITYLCLMIANENYIGYSGTDWKYEQSSRILVTEVETDCCLRCDEVLFGEGWVKAIIKWPEHHEGGFLFNSCK